ncbi:F0F1 ATP synthase subunit epsilon [Corynebacterium sp. ES2794-CONJ1]|uniref:F0F1 ATP synthase subunit epsilon n=1 Tax=unclassified Corynebacterium TaxID=2624378 RepID=UPI0021688275|nr:MULTISPECIES: F0F1 ATP synthase subunit epsilon [unclassified Corynebacterium]MCS4489818.1 F0F1 ATP synthase subunit epsilon [Corynebacterium sp. ES2775-CONJ]MCS4491818.1 F0F1 ATP synthase subunit epsilon [Corynebacterium sp. ES2715-CONJ3]MCS4531923.1 F0F1 ATP synthase subunit epsilon [Corynebacterium sp. ES2730-CONJ]MCU9519324.1 F0F1 ATP synthase subunit epsilon [Corynebacterium sp. ES2794-CONJ1]
MADITVELVSPERMLWSGTATIVTAQTTEGEIGVLAGHEPMLGQLVDNGVVTISPTDGEKRYAAVQGGFLSVSKEKVTILAEYAVWASEINSSDSTQRLQDPDKVAKLRAQAELKALKRSGRS